MPSQWHCFIVESKIQETLGIGDTLIEDLNKFFSLSNSDPFLQPLLFICLFTVLCIGTVSVSAGESSASFENFDISLLFLVTSTATWSQMLDFFFSNFVCGSGTGANLDFSLGSFGNFSNYCSHSTALDSDVPFGSVDSM